VARWMRVDGWKAAAVSIAVVGAGRLKNWMVGVLCTHARWCPCHDLWGRVRGRCFRLVRVCNRGQVKHGASVCVGRMLCWLMLLMGIAMVLLTFRLFGSFLALILILILIILLELQPQMQLLLEPALPLVQLLSLSAMKLWWLWCWLRANRWGMVVVLVVVVLLLCLLLLLLLCLLLLLLLWLLLLLLLWLLLLLLRLRLLLECELMGDLVGGTG